MSSVKPKPICQYTVTWMKAVHGKGCFAPFTGQDWSVYMAYVHLLEAWFRSDHLGQPLLIEAMRNTLQACQPCVLPLAKAAIIAVGDHGFVDEIWPQIKPEIPVCSVDPSCSSGPIGSRTVDG